MIEISTEVIITIANSRMAAIFHLLALLHSVLGLHHAVVLRNARSVIEWSPDYDPIRKLTVCIPLRLNTSEPNISLVATECAFFPVT